LRWRTLRPQFKRDPLGSRVRASFLLGIVLIVACDPARIARFGVYPTDATLAPDAIVLSQSLQIARSFAEKYQMQSMSGDRDCPLGRYFVEDTVHGRQVGLNFCVRTAKGATEFRLVEIITSEWGEKGNALRLELLDTLRTCFGTSAVREQ